MFVQHFSVDKALSQPPLSVHGKSCHVLHAVMTALEPLSVICTIDWNGLFYDPCYTDL